MVLDNFNFEINEPKLASICRVGADGVSADDLVSAANELGFHAWKEYSTIVDIQTHLNNGVFPILYVNLLAIDGLAIIHAFVLEEMTRESVTVVDPWYGRRRKISLQQFKVAWEKTRHLAVLVKKSKE
jgi:ABC-type bacteriocin/lantibiotic exporter with double-glycine peptidase domain